MIQAVRARLTAARDASRVTARLQEDAHSLCLPATGKRCSWGRRRTTGPCASGPRPALRTSRNHPRCVRPAHRGAPACRNAGPVARLIPAWDKPPFPGPGWRRRNPASEQAAIAAPVMILNRFRCALMMAVSLRWRGKGDAGARARPPGEPHRDYRTGRTRATRHRG